MPSATKKYRRGPNAPKKYRRGRFISNAEGARRAAIGAGQWRRAVEKDLISRVKRLFASQFPPGEYRMQVTKKGRVLIRPLDLRQLERLYVKARSESHTQVLVGTRAKLLFGGAMRDVEVIEDRGHLGIDCRQIVRVKIDDDEDPPEQTETVSFEVPAEWLKDVRRPKS